MMISLNQLLAFDSARGEIAYSEGRISLNIYTERAMRIVEDALNYMSYFNNAYEQKQHYTEHDVKLDIPAGIFRPYRLWPYVENPKDLDFVRPSSFRLFECKLNGEAFAEYVHDGRNDFAKYFNNDNHSDIERIEILLRKWEKHLKDKLNSVLTEGRNAFVKDIIDDINACESIIRNWHGNATDKDIKIVGHPLTPFEEATVFDKILNEYNNIDYKNVTAYDQNQKWFKEIMRYTTN